MRKICYTYHTAEYISTGNAPSGEYNWLFVREEKDADFWKIDSDWIAETPGYAMTLLDLEDIEDDEEREEEIAFYDNLTARCLNEGLGEECAKEDYDYISECFEIWGV